MNIIKKRMTNDTQKRSNNTPISKNPESLLHLVDTGKKQNEFETKNSEKTIKIDERQYAYNILDAIMKQKSFKENIYKDELKKQLSNRVKEDLPNLSENQINSLVQKMIDKNKIYTSHKKEHGEIKKERKLHEIAAVIEIKSDPIVIKLKEKTEKFKNKYNKLKNKINTLKSNKKELSKKERIEIKKKIYILKQEGEIIYENIDKHHDLYSDINSMTTQKHKANVIYPQKRQEGQEYHEWFSDLLTKQFDFEKDKYIMEIMANSSDYVKKKVCDLDLVLSEIKYGEKSEFLKKEFLKAEKKEAYEIDPRILKYCNELLNVSVTGFKEDFFENKELIKKPSKFMAINNRRINLHNEIKLLLRYFEKSYNLFTLKNFTGELGELYIKLKQENKHFKDKINPRFELQKMIIDADKFYNETKNKIIQFLKKLKTETVKETTIKKLDIIQTHCEVMLYDYIDILKLLTNKEFKDYIENKFDLINTILGKVGILQDQAKDDNRNLDPSIINKILEII